MQLVVKCPTERPRHRTVGKLPAAEFRSGSADDRRRSDARWALTDIAWINSVDAGREGLRDSRAEKPIADFSAASDAADAADGAMFDHFRHPRRVAQCAE